MGAIAEDLTYDAALAQLEAILATLEGDDLPLEQALTLYEEGALLAAFCARKLEEAELRGMLEQSVGQLPEGLRLVFVMRELQQKSYEEISEILETTPEAVRVRLHRAKKELLKRLRPYLDEAGKESG